MLRVTDNSCGRGTLKGVTGFFLLVAVALTPAMAAADLTASISDGTTTLTSPKGGFNALSAQVSQTIPSITTVQLLTTSNTCSTTGTPGGGTSPCPVGFPSGQRATTTTPIPASDTFTFQDLSATSKATITLNLQSTTAQITLTNVVIKSRVSGKTLTISYGTGKTSTGANDLPTIQTAGSYFATVALGGSFKSSAGLQATACALGTSSPCVQSSMRVNGVSVNGVGANTTTLVTVTAPCLNGTTVPCSPAGGSGSYSSALGTFTAISDTGSVSCGTACAPTEQGTITAKFNGIGDTLTLTGSNSAAASFIGLQDPNSLTGIITALQGELGTNLFVNYTSSNTGQYAMIPNPPLTNQTRNINNNSNLPLSFYMARALPQAANQVSLVSIGCDNLPDDDADSCQTTVPLAPAATSSNDAGYLTFVPSTLLFKNLNNLQVFYDVKTGSLPSGDPRLGSQPFVDCAAGSFRVDITLADPATNAIVGTVHVYLGSAAADHFRSGCQAAEATLSGINLAGNNDARVDTTGVLNGSCCGKFKQAQGGQRGNLIVRAVTVVVDQGVGAGSPTFDNYRVDVTDMFVGAFSAANPAPPATPGFTVVTGPFVQTADLLQNGTFMRITKLSSPGNCTGLAGEACPTIVKVIPSSDISTTGGKYSSAVNVVDILAVAGGTTYAVEMCLFGSPSQGAPPMAFTPGNQIVEQAYQDYYKSFQGICPGTVGIVNLK